jgi:hypothetical protein
MLSGKINRSGSLWEACFAAAAADDDDENI